MAVTTFAAIDVGSHETSLRIYEISKKIGIHELDYVHHSARLGYETYSTKHISYHSIDKLCTILNGFKDKMKEYQITDYMIAATSALREADNNLIVLDQVRQRTGFKIKILSNSEQRYLCYKSIALTENAFHKLIQKGALLVDVGGGSMQLSLFDKSSLVTTQNILLGSLRIQEILQNMKNQTDNYQNLVYEYISNDLHTFSELYLKKYKIKNIIAVGNQLRIFVKYLSVHNFGHIQPTDSKGKKKDSVSRQEYEEFYQSISSQHPEELARELDTSLEQASLLLPTAMIYHNIFEETGAEQMWLSGITLCEGMAADFAEKKEKFVPDHNFVEDIVHAARSLAMRYECSSEHCESVEQAALKIFDALKRQQNMTKHDRLLLQIAVILHNCGSYINLNDVGENSYKIVMSTELIGISHKERMIVASVVRYLQEYFPEFQEIQDVFDREDYVKIAKLNAILRLADAMDRSHKQKFKHLTTALRNRQLVITGDTLYDITLEQGIFELHSSFFEEVYGIKPVLKQKKTF
ncbi:MAG: HD domain-containing protein [Lachnospiraceae bacterium]|nr:HD domain-containing protein [Lachnospiraceae bacterium]MBP3458952.1 HD domain-containing protein [Lachnospiraceae bacterium]